MLDSTNKNYISQIDSNKKYEEYTLIIVAPCALAERQKVWGGSCCHLLRNTSALPLLCRSQISLSKYTKLVPEDRSLNTNSRKACCVSFMINFVDAERNKEM